jgi:hypothetical protein
MGYLLTAAVHLAEDEWADLVRMAEDQGAPEPAPPARDGGTVLAEKETEELAHALRADLDDPLARPPSVERETVERIITLLRAGDRVRLEHTPPWKSGD